MARPIRETPVLSGKDARRFERAMREVEKYCTEEQRKANRQKLRSEYEQICKEWNLTFKV